MQLDEKGMTDVKSRDYLNKVITNANKKRNQMKGYKASETKKFNKGQISESITQLEHKRIDNARAILNEYIKYYEEKSLIFRIKPKRKVVEGRKKERQWCCLLQQK